MHVSLQGIKIPFGGRIWLYRIFVDGTFYDSFTSKKQLTAQEMLDTENTYAESILAYGKFNQEG